MTGRELVFVQRTTHNSTILNAYGLTSSKAVAHLGQEVKKLFLVLDSLLDSKEIQELVNQSLNLIKEGRVLVKLVKQLRLRELRQELSKGFLWVPFLEDDTHTTHSRSAGKLLWGCLYNTTNLLSKALGKECVLRHKSVYDGVNDFVANYTELILADFSV